MIPDKSTLERIIKELQPKMKIADWDIELSVLTAAQMQKEEQDIDTLGASYRDMRRNNVIIRINKEDDLHNDNTNEWYITLLHEIDHIQSTEFIIYCRTLFDLLDVDEDKKEALKDHFDTLYEQLTHKRAKTLAELYPVTNFIKEGCVNDGQSII
jgi:hypothetical protein